MTLRQRHSGLPEHANKPNTMRSLNALLLLLVITKRKTVADIRRRK